MTAARPTFGPNAAGGDTTPAEGSAPDLSLRSSALKET